MGAWVLASVFYACAVLTDAHNPPSVTNQQVPTLLITRELKHSAVPIHDNPETSATNYQLYNIKLPSIDSSGNIRSPATYNYGGGGSYEEAPKYSEFASIEAEAGGYDNLDTTGYTHYKTATSFNLEGPKQLETITTHSFHKEVAPYDTFSFQTSHKDEENQGDVHYHQHKHVHKHDHKQEHVHKHRQQHRHEHGHKHDHQAKHDHKHNAQHKHSHNSEHKHNHKGEHHHKHQQEHKHSHRAQNAHEHTHQQEHKHDHHHGHKHNHHQEHKHSHRQEHKHHHHHGHKHEGQYQHKHEHKGEHKHNHGHKDEHKHQHRSKNKHAHYKH